ncbi:MAG: hypothetical protein ACOZAJ_00305 [Patescibacteria group bacterium]
MFNFKPVKTNNFVKNLSLEEKQIYAVFLYQRFSFLEESIRHYFLKNQVNFTINHYHVYLRIFRLLKKSYYRGKSFGLDLDWPGEPRLQPDYFSWQGNYYCPQKSIKILLGSFMFLLKEINGSSYGKTPAVVAGIKKIKFLHNKYLVSYKKICNQKVIVKEEPIISTKDNSFFVSNGIYC